MFFIFIGGISHHTSTLRKSTQQCWRCGSQDTELREAYNRFSLFFVPLFRVGHSKKFLQCNRCGFTDFSYKHHPSIPPTHDQQQQQQEEEGRGEDMYGGMSLPCPHCGMQDIQPQYRYCPHCGLQMR